ncbi:MAG: hypothetical protein OSB45_06235 [Pseudomonadales bacterium]|nr:hypothetical protein [Pseudomonadales bacterium]
MTNVLVLSDSGNSGRNFLKRIQNFISTGDLAQTPEFTELKLPVPGSRSDFLNSIETQSADLMVTHHHLFETFTDPNLGLGTYLETLLQSSPIPLMIVPHYLDPGLAPATEKLEDVLVISDHFSNSDELINWSAEFVSNSGALWLTHVESEVDFERYMQAIARIPELDTETARTTLCRELLHESMSYIQNCKQQLAKTNPALAVELLACMGQPLHTYRQWLCSDKHELLVIPALAEDRFAQRALTGQLASEYPHIALLIV